MKGWPIMEVESEKRRFAILRHLMDTPGRELNDMILADGCRVQGIPTTGDQARTAMNWLAENDLVAVRSLGRFMVAKLTRAGSEVARGITDVPGILRFGEDD